MVVWCLLLAFLLLPVGGLSIDLWRGIAAQRALRAAAEDAASAGASGIDVDEYRQYGCIRLDPATATSLAEQYLSDQPIAAQVQDAQVSVNAARTAVTVVISETVPLTLLRLAEGNQGLVVRASASSGPVGSIGDGAC